MRGTQPQTHNRILAHHARRQVICTAHVVYSDHGLLRAANAAHLLGACALPASLALDSVDELLGCAFGLVLECRLFLLHGCALLYDAGVGGRLGCGALTSWRGGDRCEDAGLRVTSCAAC